MTRIGRFVSGRTASLSIMLTIALCLGGCARVSSGEREQAEQDMHNAQIEADWQNVVNEARPVMAALNGFEEQYRQMQNDQAAAEATNQAGSK